MGGNPLAREAEGGEIYNDLGVHSADWDWHP